MEDDFNFSLIGADKLPFTGYVSSIDKTNASPQVMVQGSKNVYKKDSGTIAVRPGLKRYGLVDATASGVVSSYEWETSIGVTRPMRVLANGKLQTESTIVDGVTPIWYDLINLATQTRVVFDSWWNNVQKRDVLVFVAGDSNYRYWGGGITRIGTTVTTSIYGVGNNALLTVNGSMTASNIASIYAYSNQQAGTSAFFGIVMLINPSNGDTLQFNNLNGDAVTIHFVSAIGAVAGNVLIGTNSAATVTNLLGLLQNPSTTNATQVAVTAPDPTNLSYITFASGNALGKQSSATTWAQDGFYIDPLAGAKTVTINGTTYTYQGGEGSQYLFGISPSPAGEPAGSVALQGVVTKATTPVANYNNDFIRTIGNQIHVGSYTSRLIYISSSSDFTGFTVPDPRAPGDPDLLTLDNTGRGIGVSKGNAVISAGLADWYVVQRQNITVGTTLTEQVTVQKQKTASLGAALAHEFIDNLGDNIVYLSQSQQVQIQGSFQNYFQNTYTSLSQQVRDEFMDVDFTLGHLRVIDTYIYVTSPSSGKTYLYQSRDELNGNGSVVAEKLWHPYQQWNGSRIALINGVTYIHSNANPQIYQVWDTNQWYDDVPDGTHQAYDAAMIMSYRNSGKRNELISFDKLWIEGYILENSDLNVTVLYDYFGSNTQKGEITEVVSALGNSPIIYAPPLTPAVGEYEPGTQAIGGGILPSESGSLLPKFRTILDFDQVDCFEFQVQLYSAEVDSEWEILSVGPNIAASDDYPVFLRRG